MQEQSHEGGEADHSDLDKIIQERERLDGLFKEKFTRTIAVMFTDLKGSTSLAESQGDFAVRAMLKQHNDIVIPAVKKHKGVLVKTMGDGTMSYFESAQEALRAGAEIQRGMDAFNLQKTLPIPILMRVGIHVGLGIVEQKDIFGDVVNVASRIEGQANPGEVYLSGEAYLALSDRTEIHCGFVREAVLKGKKEPYKLYKAFWNPNEADKAVAKTAAPERAEPRGIPLAAKLLVLAALALLAALAYTRLKGVPADEERRTHDVRIEPDAAP